MHRPTPSSTLLKCCSIKLNIIGLKNVRAIKKNMLFKTGRDFLNCISLFEDIKTFIEEELFVLKNFQRSLKAKSTLKYRNSKAFHI